MKAFPSRETLCRLPSRLADIAVTISTLLLLAVILRVGDSALESFRPPDVLTTINPDPRNLPYYAGNSALRMFVALLCSLGFPSVYGYIAATLQIWRISLRQGIYLAYSKLQPALVSWLVHWHPCYRNASP